MSSKKRIIYTEEEMTVDQYRSYKRDMLKNDFCINMTQEEELQLMTCKTFPEVNSCFVTILNKYWK